VAIVGAGFIGFGWSLVFGRAGLETRVYDADPRQLGTLQGRIDSALDLLARVGRIKPADVDPIRQRIVMCSDLSSAVEGAEYVQECVPENLRLKQNVFSEVDRLAAPGTIIASSVSALPMTRIAEKTTHPERCIAAHPTNPPHIVPLVEIIAGEKTSPETVQTTYEFLKRVGQEPILVRKEVFGYVLNRLQFALVREALYLARQDVASIADIDKCIHQGLGLRWAFLGPFGVEATNAESIEADLRKYAGPMKELMAQVCQPYDGPSEDEIESVVREVNVMFAGKTSDELIAYRDAMVLRARELKEQHRLVDSY
jgi:3-hydroxyacyl-CoA dehydrogenase